MMPPNHVGKDLPDTNPVRGTGVLGDLYLHLRPARVAQCRGEPKTRWRRRAIPPRGALFAARFLLVLAPPSGSFFCSRARSLRLRHGPALHPDGGARPFPTGGERDRWHGAACTASMLRRCLARQRKLGHCARPPGFDRRGRCPHPFSPNDRFLGAVVSSGNDPRGLTTREGSPWWTRPCSAVVSSGNEPRVAHRGGRARARRSFPRETSREWLTVVDAPSSGPNVDTGSSKWWDSREMVVPEVCRGDGSCGLLASVAPSRASP